MMKPLPCCFAADFLLRVVCLVFNLSLANPFFFLWAQTYPIKNDRLLAPEVSHFARIVEPGVDAHGDLNLPIPLMTVPGRDGLDFDLVANYRSGIQLTQSASWIGLGWSLDVGSITRHPLGSLSKDDMNDGNSEHIDWVYALAPAHGDVIGRTLDSQPDVYIVNLNGSSTALLPLTLEANPVPAFPFTPANPFESGQCFQGQSSVSVPWYFIPSPWRPWKFCYATANPVYVDGRRSGIALPATGRADFLKFMITTEDGTRYVFSQPSLSEVYFPRDDLSPTQYDYQRLVSTWRLTAILSPNYSYLSGDEVPVSTSPGGWVKITYQTIDDSTGNAPKTVDTIETACCNPGHLFAQITYPSQIETPTHYALFETKPRYDLDLAHDPDGTRRDYNRLLSKIKLYRKGSPDQLINEVAFTYKDNGALSLSTPPSQTNSILSKLALEKITLKGWQGAVGDSIPAYKFSYQDTSVSWFTVAHSWLQPIVPLEVDDFGFYHNHNGIYSPDREGSMWSLQEVAYPDGGRHVFTYESDVLNTTSLSYNKYTSNALGPGTYQAGIAGNFSRAKQGGARVKSITTYDGYNSAGYIVNFTYGPGRAKAIPEIWFLKNYEDPITSAMYSSGERGQAAVIYDWIEKSFLDGSRIKTFYETGDGTPEPATLYKITNLQYAILQSNTRWNWGEVKKQQHFAANGLITGNRVQEEIFNWSYQGQSGDPNPIKIATIAPAMDILGGATQPINLNFTHKRLDSKITKHILTVATGIDSVTMTETYLYNSDGTLLSSKTEISDDGKIRKMEYKYARENTGAPYTGMKDRNLRTQVAQTSIKDNSNNGYSSSITTWKTVTHFSKDKYLPDKEYRWRNNVTPATMPSFNWSNPDTNSWIRAQTFLEYDADGNPTRIHDAYSSETTVYWDATGTLIDSIAARPNATTTLTTRYAYDPNTFNLTSTTDPNGQKTEYQYDPLQRLIQTIMPDKRIASEFAYYYSRQGAGNNDTFNALDPNYVKTRALTGAEFFEPFEYIDAPENHGWGVHYGAGLGTMTTVYDNALQSRVLRVDVNVGVPNENYAVKYPAAGELNTKSKHLWVKTKSSLGNSSFRVAVMRSGQEYTLRYYFDNGTDSYNAGTKAATFYLGATFKDGNWHTLERDLEQDFKLTGLPSYDYIRRVVAVGEYDLDQIQLQNHPITSFAFVDGVGRGIQTLQNDSTGAIKSGTFYDAQDRVVKVTKPFWHGNTKFVRADSVITYANTYYSTKHPVYHDSLGVNEFDTGNYAYAEIEYFPDPLGRVRHQYAPGDTFSSANNRYVKYRYGTNVAGEMGIANAASVFETRIFDENDVKTEIFTDTFGNKVAVRNDSSGANNNGNSPKLATGFQYDILNNLTKIAPPKAFNIADNNKPDWNSAFCTVMTYNSFSQLTSRQTPDAGTDSMFYDKQGNLRLVKDANGVAGNYFIYYKYDNLNRKTEEGQTNSAAFFRQDSADVTGFPTTSYTWKVKYYYDASSDPTQRNLKGRLYRMDYTTDRYPNMTGYIFYSYDANGNVEWTRQNIPKSNVNDGNGYINAQVDYQYDALGKATKTYFRRTFPPGAGSNAFYTWYDYDAVGRLENVYTNTADARVAPPNARYTYWPGGQVKRLVLGGSVQGVDYLYNSRDWLTQINHQNLWHTQDPGGDGGPGSSVYNVDRFGQIIGYNKQKQIATGHADFAAQYNGNISWTIHRTTGNVKPVAVNSSLTGWVFKYDQANRLTKANWGHYTTSWQTSNRYDLTGIVYDRHGNLEYMTRYDTASVVTNMDYLYTANTNKLHQISGLNGQGANNYTYDASGNMIKDIAKLGSTSTILYDYRNLPWQVPKTTSPSGTINFGYDAKGQRVSKNNWFYVPGLDGRVVAVYDVNGTLLYWNVWGLDLIGQRFWKQ